MPFCRRTWGTWTEPGLAAYYAGHPSYPRDRNPPIHYTVCEPCSTVRHLVARMDDEKQRLADLRHVATLFPDNPEIREQTRLHAVALATLTRDLEDLSDPMMLHMQIFSPRSRFLPRLLN